MGGFWPDRCPHSQEMATSHISQGLKKIKPTIHYISYQVYSGASIYPDIFVACEPPTHVWPSTSVADESNRNRTIRNLFLTVLTETGPLTYKVWFSCLSSPINLQGFALMTTFINLCMLNHFCICKRSQLNCGGYFFFNVFLNSVPVLYGDFLHIGSLGRSA